MRIGVVTFPGSLDDHDAARAVRSCGGEAVSLWHRDADLHGVDAVVLPGGFSYGDYLRAGAISRFAPVMDVLVPAAQGGLPVLGICNGFQILCESHLLPGAMIQNDHRTFVCRDQRLRVENSSTAFTSDFEAGQEITVVLKNQDGQFVADTDTLDRLEGRGAWPSATWGSTRTARLATSPASPTSAATSSASCPTPSTRSRRASARASTAAGSSPPS